MTEEEKRKIKEKALLYTIKTTINDTKTLLDDGFLSSRVVKNTLLDNIKKLENCLEDAREYSLDQEKIDKFERDYNILKNRVGEI